MTVTTHSSAEAVGTATTALEASTRLAVATVTLSFLLFDTFARFIPREPCTNVARRDHLAANT